MDLDYSGVSELCYSCLYLADCWEARNRYVLDCWNYESVEEDAYPDGDAYWEYMNAALFGKEAVGHAD